MIEITAWTLRSKRTDLGAKPATQVSTVRDLRFAPYDGPVSLIRRKAQDAPDKGVAPESRTHRSYAVGFADEFAQVSLTSDEADDGERAVHLRRLDELGHLLSLAVNPGRVGRVAS